MKFTGSFPTQTGLKIMAIALGLILLFLIALFSLYIPFVEKELFNSRKMAAKNLVDSVYSMVEDYEQRVSKGAIERGDAKSEVKQTVRHMRFRNHNYFWINDTTRPYPRMILHPVLPELEGRIMDHPSYETASRMEFTENGTTTLILEEKKNIFLAFLSVCEKAGGGYVRYDWPRPIIGSTVSEATYPKESYVRLFSPWGWIIGTGVYMDDVYEHMNRLYWSILWITGAILALALLASFVLMRTITRPIAALAGFARDVGEGRLDSPIRGRFTGEMGDLKNAISHMVDELKGRMQEAERKASEAESARQKLRASEEKYRLIFENAPLGFLHFDEHGVITACNDLLVDIIGSSRKDMVGLALLELPDQAMVAAVSGALSGHPGFYEGYYRSVTADKVTPLRALFAPFFSEGEEAIVVGGMGIVEDIGERMRTENALRKSEEKYRILVENAQEAIFVAQDERFCFANERTSELLACSLDELIGSPLHHYIHPEDAGLVMERHFDRIAGKQPPSAYSFRVLTRNGETRWVELKAVAIEWEGRRATLNFLSDITEQKKAEEMRERLQSRLHQAQKMEALGRLTGGVAHDFNNMLSIIMGYAEILENDLPPSISAGKGIREIKEASMRAREVIRQLLTFSRKGEEAQTIQDISAVVSDGGRMMRSTIPSSIVFRTEIGPDLPMVWANSTQIHQVIVNLCKNAADAMADSGGEIRLELEAVSLTREELPDPELAVGDYVKLAVSDTGEGIPPNNVERIFDPYFTTKDMEKGTGLGLSVVLGIVKSHRGAVRVDSRPGSGTRFEVYLPAARGGAGPEKAPVSTGLPGGNERLLFVDDEPSVTDLNRLRLKRLGYEVEDCCDPVEALEKFRSDPERFELVITDMSMPKMTGDVLSLEIQKLRPGMKIILCSGYSELVSEETAAALGISRYIEKPIDLRTLAVAIREVLDGKTGSQPHL